MNAHTFTADALAHHDALAAARHPVTGSAPFAALLSKTTARELVNRIDLADARTANLHRKASMFGRDLTPAEDAQWSAAERDRAEARAALVALVADRLGISADILMGALA